MFKYRREWSQHNKENMQKARHPTKEEGGPPLQSSGGGRLSHFLFYLEVEVTLKINKARESSKRQLEGRAVGNRVFLLSQ